MKKRFLVLTTMPIFAFATSQFNILIDNNQNQYSIEKYVGTGVVTCDTYNITENDLYYGETGLQNGTDCYEEYSNSNGGNKQIPVADQTTTITGTFLAASCKGVLTFNPLLTTKNYNINLNGNTISVSCDMDTDNGGWTLITSEQFSGDDLAPTYSIDDKGLDYSEVMYADNGSFNSYGGGVGNWDWRGIEVGRQAFKFDNTWYNRDGDFLHVCNHISNSLSVSDYRIIEGGITNCHYSTTDINSCYNKVAVKVPNNSKITGFGDVESIYNDCNSDNTYSLDFKLYVR